MKAPKGKDRELPPEGGTPLKCVAIIDLGTQTPPPGSKFKASRQLQYAFELCGLPQQTTEEGSPFVIYKTLGFFSSEQSNMAKLYKSWLGVKDMPNYDIEAALGKMGYGTIGHKPGKMDPTKIQANFETLLPLPAGVKASKGKEPLVLFMMDEEEEFDQTAFDALPEFLQKKIVSSPEYAALKGSAIKSEKTKKDTKAAVKKGKK